MTAKELAEITKLDVDKAKKAIEKESFTFGNKKFTPPFQVDKNSDKVLSRQEFHDLMNRNRIRNPRMRRGDRAFEKLDTNKV